jgi:hypothetical protein
MLEIEGKPASDFQRGQDTQAPTRLLRLFERLRQSERRRVAVLARRISVDSLQTKKETKKRPFTEERRNKGRA